MAICSYKPLKFAIPNEINSRLKEAYQHICYLESVGVGGSQNIEQVLTQGSILSNSHTINAGTNNFGVTNAGTLTFSATTIGINGVTTITGATNIVGALTVTTGNVTAPAYISANPGNGAGTWLLGKKVTATVALVTSSYIEVKIDGVVYKLGIVN